MSGRRVLSIVEQVTESLRDGMINGRWRDTLPGRDRLAKELGVSHKSVESAMRKLAKEGLLVSQGAGQRRRIVLPEGGQEITNLRLRLIPYEPADRGNAVCIEILEELNKVGFSAGFATKSLTELNMDVKRISRFVAKTPADAWIVTSGSLDVLQWFSEQDAPAFAFFGSKSKVDIAGVGIRRNIESIIKNLVSLGHRRIVHICREDHIKPTPSLFIREFLAALKAEGIQTGAYNTPIWGYNPKQLRTCLNSLFKHTSPTALIVSEAPVFIAARDHLSRLGIHAPEDVSLISLDPDPSFSWTDPQVSHFAWDYSRVVKRIVRWAKKVSQGENDLRQTNPEAKFIEGGSIGPAPKP